MRFKYLIIQIFFILFPVILFSQSKFYGYKPQVAGHNSDTSNSIIIQNTGNGYSGYYLIRGTDTIKLHITTTGILMLSGDTAFQIDVNNLIIKNLAVHQTDTLLYISNDTIYKYFNEYLSWSDTANMAFQRYGDTTTYDATRWWVEQQGYFNTLDSCSDSETLKFIGDATGIGTMTITACGNNYEKKVWEHECNENAENDWILPFNLTAESIISYNGAILRNSQWSGIGNNILVLYVDSRLYDYITINQ